MQSGPRLASCAMVLLVTISLCALLAAPAFAQPFADVPTNHWAYDVIAELAAKGLVEGYPDGTFKGDRAMTRYEMAMVVARLLARIESIQIPPAAPAPQVTKADLDALQRLINEFRAELAALGVRVTAIEEELNAIKAKLSNVRITGRFRFRYDGGPGTAGLGPNAGNCPSGSVNGNGNTCNTDLGTSPTEFRARLGGKLMIDGRVTPDIHAIIGLELATGLTSTPATFNGAGYATGGAGGAGAGCTGGSPCYQFANIAELYFDWNNAWGWPLRIQLGRMGGIQQDFGMGAMSIAPFKFKKDLDDAKNDEAKLPQGLQFGPYGLLLKATSDVYGASTGNAGTFIVDGLRLSGNVPTWADLSWHALIWRVLGPTGGTSYFLGEDAYGVEANIRIAPELHVGGYYLANSINAASPVFPGNATSALWHVYGNPATPLTNPPTAAAPSSGPGCPAVATIAGGLASASGGGPSQGGIECHALGSGGGGYAMWEFNKVILLGAEIATWSDATSGVSDSAYWVGGTFDLGTLTGVGHKLSLTLSYINEGVNFYAPYQNTADSDISGTVGPGNARLFTGDLTFNLNDTWSVTAAYITGNNVSNGMGITEYKIGVTYKFAPGAMIYTRVENQRINGISQYTLYRSELTYTF